MMMKIRQWYRENDLDSILYLSFKTTKAQGQQKHYNE